MRPFDLAGAETALACTVDVVLFVWMTSTHAVFRAFDGFDKKQFCYVQGTGASSIVRTLDRWLLNYYSRHLTRLFDSRLYKVTLQINN